jgi:ankyrin repeat protein
LLAARNGHNAVVELLLQIDGVDAGVQDVDGRTPLSWAARKGHRKVIEILLNSGRVDVNVQDTNRWTPLYYAASTVFPNNVKRTAR